MTLSRNIKLFTAVNLVASLSYFYMLNSAIGKGSWKLIVVLSVLYAFVWFLTGMTLGRADTVRHYPHAGITYHAAVTLITVVAVSLASLFLQHIRLRDAAWTSGGMLFGLIAHWLAVIKKG